MVKRVDLLTNEQRSRMDAWADRWIEIGLCTGAADRPKFEAAVQKCYQAAGLTWHGNVVWVSSPMVMALAAPVAAFVLELGRRGAVGGAVRDAVGGAVLRKAISQVISDGWRFYIGGQFWVGGWGWGGAYTSFFREVCGLDLRDDLWDRGIAYEATIQAACWWWPHKDFVMVCERPTEIHRELNRAGVQRGWGSHRLHCDDGPAVAWPDGWGVYSVHGVRIPFWKRYIVENPERISVAEIEAETNAEIRRVMLNKFGAARYVKESGAKVAHELPADHAMTGLRSARLLVKLVPDDEAIVYVDLLNSTPEPDGTTKRYMLRVDPNAYGGVASRDCLAAVASTWRNGDGSLAFKRPQDYRPSFES
jgi:hypothetical protein